MADFGGGIVLQGTVTLSSFALQLRHPSTHHIRISKIFENYVKC